MKIEQAAAIRDLIVAEQWADGANYALGLLGKPPSIKTKVHALPVLRALLQHLLDNDLYLHAATLLWGEDMFNAKPESVGRIFTALQESPKVLLCGGSSLSKTYSAGAYYLLDYLRDPIYTAVKLAAVNEDHLRKNLFAHVATLFRSMSIPSDHNIVIRDTDLWLGVKDAGFEFGITGITFKQSRDRGGSFKGHKAKPVRLTRHPKFGLMSRLRVLIDEGQDVPGGPFQDLNSILASVSGDDMVKLAIAFNPESLDRIVVKMAEPKHGWSVEDVETLYEWESASGWRVCRLDAARCENVIQRKVIYPSFQTYDGFIGYLRAAGDSSAEYFCFARGWPPMRGSVNILIPPSWPQDARGEATFIETPIDVAAVDLAYTGIDSAQMAIGRWGLASGWTNQNREYEMFMDRISITTPRPRHVLQIDQIIPLEKHEDTVKMAEDIMGKGKMMGIKPENCGVDYTGIGFGTHSHLNRVWGEVIGIGWGKGATDMKVLAEDNEPASSTCDGLMSEMWWAFTRWIDPRCRAILINPIIPPQPIQTQLTSRRYKTGKHGIKVESKEEYKARNQKSPDEADCCFVAGTMVVTPSGEAPIESLSVGDQVVTPFGVTRVGMIHITEAQNITTLGINNGRVLQGKGAHRIFTWNKGWVRMDALVLTDHLESAHDLWIWNILNRLFTKKEHITFKLLVDIIKTGTRLRQRDFFIESSGSSTLGLLLKVFTSTTRTVIGLITRRITWPSCRHQITRSTTCLHSDTTPTGLSAYEGDRSSPSLRQLSGTNHQKEKNGTGGMAEGVGPNASPELESALSVAGSMRPFSQRDGDAAPLNAKIKEGTRDFLKRSVSVLSAGVISLVRCARRRKLAPKSVVQRLHGSPATTYNLTLEDHNVYYANGVLVENCIMLCQVVRNVSPVIPGLTEQTKPSPHEQKNTTGFVSIKNLKSVDMEDSICQDGQDG